MKRLCQLLVYIMAFCGIAHAATCNISAGASSSAAQTIINGCASPATISIAAGTYSAWSNINIPSSVSVITGPPVWPNTAIINGVAGTTIFRFPGGASNYTLEYLGMFGAGALYQSPGTASNINILHNTTGNLPSSTSGAYNQTGSMYFDGSGAWPVPTTDSYTNMVIEYNSFGDTNSCTAVIADTGTDAGGLCAGVYFNPTNTVNLTVRYNKFLHLEEGIHINQVGFDASHNGLCCIATSNNLDIEFNYFLNVHRIMVEFQTGIVGTGATIKNNVQQDPINAYFGSLGMSTPCCQFTNIQGTATSVNPNNSVTNNVQVNSLSGARPPYGFEAWGQRFQNNMIQGNQSNGFVWGFSQGAAWSITNNTICGAAVSSSNTYFVNERGNTSGPSISNNTTGASCSAVTSVTPTISPASGGFSGSQTVTLTDAGYTSGNQPLGNHSIYYTTDGSSPALSSTGPAGTTQLYTGPFTITSTTTVKAIGMYGTGWTAGAGPVPYPFVYPAGYGFTPSTIATATYTGGGTPAAATPVLAPTSQTFTGSLSVSIADSTPNSAIYYTTDGATPVAGPGGVIIGTQYYVSPTGSDSNNGTSPSTPWLSPNHAVNCGDVLNAAAGTYSTINFTAGKWGTVTCTSGNNVAWLKCTTFDTCKISSTTADAMWVDKSFWGVQGWEASTNGSSNNEAACFRATPSGAYILHHLVFANNIANGCQGGGFISYNTSTTAGTDYLTLVGNIAYNAAQGAGECFSGFSMYQPLNFDTVAGTHLFMGGNFAFGNIDPATCAGGPPTDGEGFNFDTLDHSQGGGAVYTGQAVAENNISVFNGGKGYEAENNNAGSTHAPIFFKNNTSFGNSTDPNQTTGCFDRGELNQQNAQNVTWTNNLAQTRNGTSCSGEPLYGFTALPPATGSIINGSWWLGISGHNTDPNTPSFVLGTGNTIGTNPTFTNPIQPPAPACSGTASVPACMASVIDNYIPIAPASTTLGYQTPSPDAVNDPLFPQWLCNVNLPAGLISSACSPIYTGPLTLSTTTTVQAIAAAPSFVNSSVASGTYTVSTPILTGGAQTNNPLTTPVNTLTVGAPAVQQIAVGSYSDGVPRNLPDSFGNTAVWTSSAPTILQVTSTGLVSCLAAGPANSQVKSAPGGVVFNVWGWTCNAATSTVATPVLTPSTENFSGTLSVSISTTTAGATIHYTTDGSTPTATSPTYTGPLSIVATTVVRALGVLSGDNPSAIATATYTQVAATISQITLSIVGSTFVNYVLVGGTAHFQANIQYSDGVILPSTTVGVNNARGDSISSWTTSSSMVGTISTGGVFTGASLGSATIQAVINGTLNSSNWVEYVSKSITTNVAGVTARGVNLQ